MPRVLNFDLDDFASMYLGLCKFFAGPTTTAIPSAISSVSSGLWNEALSGMSAWNNNFRPNFTAFFSSITDVWNNQITTEIIAYVDLKKAFLADIQNPKALDDLISNVGIINTSFQDFKAKSMNFIIDFDAITGGLPDPGEMPVGSIYEDIAKIKFIIDNCVNQMQVGYNNNLIPYTVGIVTVKLNTGLGTLVLNTGVFGSNGNIAPKVIHDSQLISQLSSVNGILSKAILPNNEFVYDWLRFFYFQGLSVPALTTELGDLILSFRTPLSLLMDSIEEVAVNIDLVYKKLEDYKTNQTAFNFSDQVNIYEITSLTTSSWASILQVAEFLNKLVIVYDFHNYNVN